MFEFIEGAVLEQISAPFHHLHAHQKSMIAVGVIHCPNSPDLDDVYPEFRQKLNQFGPESLVARCFAFEPLPTQADIARDHLIMIPNTPQGDEARLEFYLQTLVCDMCSELFRGLEEWVGVQSESVAFLETPIDLNRNPDDLAKLKKRRFGRLQKRFGDLSLMIHSPSDAIQYYAIAADVCKSNSDWVWLGGALEGQACCRDDGEFVAERCAEALRNYTRKGAWIPAVELALRLARHWAEAGGLLDAVAHLSAAHSHAAWLSLEDRQAVASACAGVCWALGLERKMAFFIREVALLFEERGAWSTARRLVAMVAPAYGLPSERRDAPDGVWPLPGVMMSLPPTIDVNAAWDQPLFSLIDGPPGEVELLLRLAGLSCNASLPPATAAVDDAVHVVVGRRIARDGPGWPAVQMETLSFLIRTSLQLNDYRAAVLHAVSFLSRFHGTLADDAQLEFAAILQETEASLGPIALRVPVQGLPVVSNVAAVSMAPHAAPVPRGARPEDTLAVGVAASPFLYSPFAPQAKPSVADDAVRWVQGEDCGVSVVVSNPLAFPIKARATLCATGCRFAALPETVMLPPASRVPVVLRARPLESGTLALSGIDVEAFGLVCLHPAGSVEVEVVPVLPTLHAWLASRAFALRLADGERRAVVLTVENVGGLPVASATLDGAVGGADTVECDWSEAAAVLSRSLPIMPGDRLLLPVSLVCRLDHGSAMEPAAASARLWLDYAGSADAEHGRRASVSLRCEGWPGVEVTGLDVAMFFGDTPPGDKCCALLELTNNSASDSFQVACSADGARSALVLLEPNASRRVVLPLVRRAFTLAGPSALPLADAALQHGLGMLRERVRVEWSSGAGATGTASLAGLSLSIPSLRWLLPAPATMTAALLDAGDVAPGQRVTVMLGVAPCGGGVPAGALRFSCVRAQLADTESRAVVAATGSGRGHDVLWYGALSRPVPALDAGVPHETAVHLALAEPGTYRFHAAVHAEIPPPTPPPEHSWAALILEVHGKARVPMCEAVVVVNVV